MLANRKAKLDWATECQTPLDETRISMFKMNNSTNSNINANTSSNPNTSSFPSSSSSASASTSSLATTTASNNTAVVPSSSSTPGDPATATATLNKDSSEKDQHPLLFHPQPPHLHQQRQQQQQQPRGHPLNMYYPNSADPAIASMGIGVGSVGMGALHPNNPNISSNTNPNMQSSQSSAQQHQQHQHHQQQQQSHQQQSQQQQQQSFIQNSPLPLGAPLPYPHHFFNNMNMGLSPDVYAATVAMQQQLGLVGVGGAGVNLLSTSHTHGHGHGHGPIHNMAGTAAASPVGQHQPNSGFPNLASMTLGMPGISISGLPNIAGLTGGLNGMGSLNVNALGVGANPNLVPGLAALSLSPSPHPSAHPLNLNHLNVNHTRHHHLHHPQHGITPPPPISPSSVGGPSSATSTGPMGSGIPGGPSANNRKLGLYKTELCRSWEEKGSCRYGPKCQFAHGEDELRRVSRHPKTFWVSGSCPYGKRCCFIHTELPSSPADGAPPPTASSNSTPANPTPVTNSSGPTSPVKNKSLGELSDTHLNAVSEQQQQQPFSLLRIGTVNNSVATSASAPVTASSTPASASPAPGQNTNAHIPSSQLATPTTEGSVTPTSAYPKNNDFSSDSEVSNSLASSAAATTPSGRSSRPTFLRVDTHINTSVSMKQNKSAFPIMNPNTLTTFSLGGMSMGGGSGISGAGSAGSSNNSGGSRLSFGRLSTGAVNAIGTNGAGVGGGASGNNAGNGMGQSQIGYGGVLLSPAPVTAGPDLGGTARRFENFDRFPKVSTPVTAQPTPANATPPRAPSTSGSSKDISPPTTSAGATSSGSGSANVRHSFTGENMGIQGHFANLTLNTNVNGSASSASIPYHGGQMKNTPPPLTAGPVPSATTAVAQAILHGRSGSDGSGVGSGVNLSGLGGLGGVGLAGLNMNMINGTPAPGAAGTGATSSNTGLNGNSGSAAWGNTNKFLSRGALSALPGGPSVVPPWATSNSGSNGGNGGSK